MPERKGFLHLLSQTVATKRFVLEPLRLSHAAEMVDVLAAPQLYEFIGGSPPGVEDLRERYARQLEGPADAEQAWLNWVVRRRADDRVLGYVQATLFWGGDVCTVDLAWLVGTDHQGAGVATEATLGVIEHLRRHDIDRFRAHIADGHRASAAVATRVGLMRTDTTDSDGERLFVSTELRLGK